MPRDPTGPLPKTLQHLYSSRGGRSWEDEKEDERMRKRTRGKGLGGASATTKTTQRRRFFTVPPIFVAKFSKNGLRKFWHMPCAIVPSRHHVTHFFSWPLCHQPIIMIGTSGRPSRQLHLTASPISLNFYHSKFSDQIFGILPFFVFFFFISSTREGRRRERER